MKSQKFWLLAVALACFGLLGGAVYFQYAYYMYPCPWCVIQRYAFAAIGLICLVSAFLSPTAVKRSTAFGSLIALGGIWVLNNVELSSLPLLSGRTFSNG